MQALIQSTSEADTWSTPLYDRPPMASHAKQERGSRGGSRVTVLGDAAHPMSMFKGEGAQSCGVVYSDSAAQHISLVLSSCDVLADVRAGRARSQSGARGRAPSGGVAAQARSVSVSVSLSMLPVCVLSL